MDKEKQQIKPSGSQEVEDRYAPAKWVSFEGRLGRARFACFCLLIVLPIIGALDIFQLLAKTHKSGLLSTELPPYLVWTVAACSILAIIPLVIQRFHDFGWPAWYSLSLLIPFANILVVAHLFIGAGQSVTNRYGAIPEPNTPIIWLLFGFLMGMPFFYFYKLFKTYLLFLLITVY